MRLKNCPRPVSVDKKIVFVTVPWQYLTCILVLRASTAGGRYRHEGRVGSHFPKCSIKLKCRVFAHDIFGLSPTPDISSALGVVLLLRSVQAALVQ